MSLGSRHWMNKQTMQKQRVKNVLRVTKSVLMLGEFDFFLYSFSILRCWWLCRCSSDAIDLYFKLTKVIFSIGYSYSKAVTAIGEIRIKRNNESFKLKTSSLCWNAIFPPGCWTEKKVSTLKRRRIPRNRNSSNQKNPFSLLVLGVRGETNLIVDEKDVWPFFVSSDLKSKSKKREGKALLCAAQLDKCIAHTFMQ